MAGVDAREEGEETGSIEGTQCEVGLEGIGRSILGRMSPMAFSRGSVRSKDWVFVEVVLLCVLIRKYPGRVRRRSQGQRGGASLGEVFSGLYLHSLGRWSSRCPSI